MCSQPHLSLSPPAAALPPPAKPQARTYVETSPQPCGRLSLMPQSQEDVGKAQQKRTPTRLPTSPCPITDPSGTTV